MNDIVVVEKAVRKYQRGVEEVRAIDGVDLNIAQGDYLAVVGRSGSGKTTLLNLIGCIDRPTSGRVSVHGLETGQLPEKVLATIRSTTIGFVFQHFFLIPTLTAIENVMLPGRFCAKQGNGDLESRAAQLLHRVGLADRAHHLPSQLSGGEMQRVALARALINEPDILLADEPTGNLDTRSADEMAATFGELNQAGLTIVVVTHSTELTGNATRIVHLRDGKIVDEQRRESQPAIKREPESRPESTPVPAYMPSSLKKRSWGSPAVALAMVLLGGIIFATAFMPFIGKFSGYGLLERGFFTVKFYSEGYSANIFSGDAATLFTGVWPMALGLVLIAAGVLFLFNRQRIGRWAAVIIGAFAAVIAAVNMTMIKSRLGQGIAVEYGLWTLLFSGLAALALGLLLLFINRRQPAASLSE